MELFEEPSSFIILLKNVFPDENYYNTNIKNDDLSNDEITFGKKQKLKNFYSIPHFFINMDEWPDNSPLVCWYCGNSFQTPPIPLAIDFTIETKIFKTVGNFHSWPCCRSFIENEQEEKQRIELNHLLYMIHKNMTGKNYKYIPTAPPKFKQQKYGGNLSEEDYMKLVKELYQNISK